MKVQILVPATAAGSSLTTALLALMIGARATFLGITLLVVLAGYVAHRCGRSAPETPPAAPQRPLPPPLLEAPRFVSPATGQRVNAGKVRL
jgi:hypothetical protein